MIQRILENKIRGELYKGKAIILFGPRQVGKTTLVKTITNSSGQLVKWLNGDESDVRDLFIKPSSTGLKQLAGEAKILVWKSIKKPQALEKLLKALAFQIGSEVSYHELAQLSGLDSHTVENYIDILQQAFIVYKVHGLYRNMRNELKKSKKIYFFDNGIRNAVIANFNMPENRNDNGALWENYLFSERLKYTHYSNIYLNRYFWRSKTEIVSSDNYAQFLGI